MLIQEKKGNLNLLENPNKTVDWLALEWFETRKRILRKKTVSGLDISLKFLNENAALTQGDILFEDEKSIVAIEVLACSCLVIQANSMFEMASVCYEIGNKHLPLFFENDELLVPFENPMQRLLVAQGYTVRIENRKLLHALRTTVSPHAMDESKSLFSRILKLGADA